MQLIEMDMWLLWPLRSRDLAPLDNLMSSISFTDVKGKVVKEILA